MVLSDPTADAWFAAMRERRRLGIAMAAIIRIIATTISNSISEKPRESFLISFSPLQYFIRENFTNGSKPRLPAPLTGPYWDPVTYYRHSRNEPLTPFFNTIPLTANGRIGTAGRRRRVLPDDRRLVGIVVVLPRGTDGYRIRGQGIGVDPSAAVRCSGGVGEAIAALQPGSQNAIEQTGCGGCGLCAARWRPERRQVGTVAGVIGRGVGNLAGVDGSE